jgi:Peptidase family S41
MNVASRVGLLVAIACAGGGCGGAQPSPPLAAAPVMLTVVRGDAGANDVSHPAGVASHSYLLLYRALVARIEALHVFGGTEGQPITASAPGPAFWREAKPILEAEFARARTKGDVIEALRHLQHSLRDGHCDYEAPELPKGDPARGLGTLMLGLDFFAESNDGSAAKAYVAKVLRPGETRVRPGDELVAIDGATLATWAEAHPFETNAFDPNTRFERTIQAAATISDAPGNMRIGDTRVMRFRRETSEFDVALTWDRPPVFGISYTNVDNNDIEAERPLAGLGCIAPNAVNYPTYQFVGGGVNYCMYLSRDPKFREYPLIRFLSFGYAGQQESAKVMRAVKSDMESLQLRLKVPHAGVVLDLRENHGGNNPHMFTRWFADKPVGNEMVNIRVAPDPVPRNDLTRAFFGEEQKVAKYEAAQKAGTPWLHEPFLNAPMVLPPMPSDRVSNKPVALVVGPGCKSSCDDMAVSFALNDLGPIVGRQTAHILTVARLPLPVRDADNTDLGTLEIALSYSTRGTDPATLEGRSLTLTTEIPKRFTNLANDDALHVEAAVAALKARATRRASATVVVAPPVAH